MENKGEGLLKTIGMYMVTWPFYAIYSIFVVPVLFVGGFFYFLVDEKVSAAKRIKQREKYWENWRKCKAEFDAFTFEEKKQYRYNLETYAKTKMTLIDEWHK